MKILVSISLNYYTPKIYIAISGKWRQDARVSMDKGERRDKSFAVCSIVYFVCFLSDWD